MNIFIESIIAGVIGSLLAVFLIEIIRKVRESKFFRRFSGYYDVFTIDDKIQEGELVELTYMGARIFKAQSKKNDQLQWKSDIVMSWPNGLHGEGVYSHLNRTEVGIHSILIKPEHNQIYVHFRILSRHNGIYGGYILKRKKE